MVTNWKYQNYTGLGGIALGWRIVSTGQSIRRMFLLGCLIGMLKYTGCFTTLVLTAGGDFLGLCDEKIHINMCPILDGYGVMDIF